MLSFKEFLKENQQEADHYKVWSKYHQKYIGSPMPKKSTARKRVDNLDNKFGSYNHQIHAFDKDGNRLSNAY